MPFIELALIASWRFPRYECMRCLAEESRSKMYYLVEGKEEVDNLAVTIWILYYCRVLKRRL